MSENTDSANNFKRYIDDFFEGITLADLLKETEE